MTRLLAVVGLAICFASAAHADRVPKEILGEWCGQSAQTEGVDYYFPGTCRDTDGWLVVKPDRYEGHELGCRFASVKTWYDRNIARNTKETGVTVARINARCGGEGCEWRESFIIYVSKGTLEIRERNRSKQECKG
jgi:hypothetical protein